MKRTLASLIPIGLLVSAASFASAPPEPEIMPVDESDRMMVGIEAHFFRPSQTDLYYVETTDAAGDTKLQYLNPSYEFSGGRIFASYMFMNDIDVQLAWSHDRENDSDRITTADFASFTVADTFVNFYLPAGGIPGDFTSTTETIQLKKEVDIDIVDLDIGHVIHDANYLIRIFAGLRYASIDDVLSIRSIGDIDNSPDYVGSYILTSKGHSDMTGIGPRGGFDVRYRLMDHFSITGHAGVALLKSRIEAKTNSILTVDQADPVVDAVVVNRAKSDKIERAVSNVDARIGLAFDFMFDEGWGVVVEGGMHVDHFYDASTVVLPDSGRAITRDVSEYGPYLGVSILFS